MYRRFCLPILLVLMACSPPSVGRGSARDWNAVRELEERVRSLNGSEKLEAKQELADALHAFVVAHPDHPEGRRMYDDLEMQFARELVAEGRLTAAAIHYESILSRTPGHPEAARELEEVQSRRRLPQELIDQLEPGMSPEQVESILGPPPPGWKRSLAKQNEVTESWIYPSSDGTITVHFVDGELLTVDS